MTNMLGKWANFAKPNPRPDPDAHFAVIHYAATVSYNLTNWLEKNKDPLNDTIVEMIKNGGNALLIQCFADHPGQPAEVKKDDGGRKKGKGGKTVSSYFKGQLDDLMTTLYKTEPHFIRCVVPNTHKQPGGVEPGLVMHQYQCNGVLAGIAICRKGFPNKMMYPEFKLRYNILAAKAVAKAKNDKAAAGAVMDVIALDKEKFRLGHTKVFFRAGILGLMEEFREDRIGQVLAWLQAGARGKASRMQFKKLQDQKLALYCCQRTIRNYYIGKTWNWWKIWTAIKPNLKCTQFGKYKAEYEEKIAIAEANIDKAIAECDAVVKIHEALSAEKAELQLALSSGGSAVQDIIDKTNRLEAAKDDLEKQVNDTLKRVKGEEELIDGINQAGTKVTADANRLRDEIKNLESTAEKCEEDKVTKDNQIRTLREEIAHQEELISKLGKEKKSCGEGRQKTEEDIQAMEDRCNHLSKVKGKLEQSLDECEDALEREKKCKGDVDKMKRKIEGDLKLTQEAVSDLERVKAELSQTIQRKEKELSSLGAKIEDEQTLGGKYSKQIKELQTRIEELDEELAIERQNRAKAEKNRSILTRDIEDLGRRLEEAGSNTSTQIELNKKRENELTKLKSDLEESNIAHEGTLAALRAKHNNTMSEMGEQIDSLNKMKAKAEKDKAGMERDLQDARGGLDESMRDRANIEKNCKLSQGLIVECNTKLDELARALNEADSTKKKLNVESQDLTRQIEETESAIATLGKNKISLTTEVENLRMRIEEEAEKKNDVLKALSKAQAEIQLWRSKFETEGLGRIDELEGSKAKLSSRVMEAEETIESLNAKISSTEKTKHGLEVELEDMQMEYERTHAADVITEKRGRNFDKVVGEWKTKADDVMAELEASRSECRNYNSEVFRLKAAYDETNEQLDVVRRENKNLADEIKDLLDQLGDGGRSIHELDKQRRRLEVEKEELQAALEEAE